MKRDVSHLMITLAAVAVLSCTAFSQNGGLKFSLKDLGANLKTAFGAQSSTANGINNRGDVTGNFWIKSDQLCFFIPANGSPVSFYLKLTTPVLCDARAVDVTGQVAGSGTYNGGYSRAFRRDTKGILHTLNPASPYTQSYGLGINKGIVVGYMDYYFSAKWDAEGGVTNLFPNVFSKTFGINSSGQVVGFAYSPHAFRSINGSLIDLGTLGGTSSSAYAINASGVIAGEADVTTGWQPHIAAWMPSTWTDIGPPGGFGLAISSDNWIVGAGQHIGWSCTPWGTGGDCYAILATLAPNCTGPFALDQLLDASGTGWTLIEATGINDSHQIVGYGRAPNGEQHAFLLTPNSLPLCYPD